MARISPIIGNKRVLKIDGNRMYESLRKSADGTHKPLIHTQTNNIEKPILKINYKNIWKSLERKN